jgi:hypothetical protein
MKATPTVRCRSTRNRQKTQHCLSTPLRSASERKSAPATCCGRWQSAGSAPGLVRPMVAGGNHRSPTLEDIGVTKTQSSRWQALPALAGDLLEPRLDRRGAGHAGLPLALERNELGAERVPLFDQRRPARGGLWVRPYLCLVSALRKIAIELVARATIKSRSEGSEIAHVWKPRRPHGRPGPWRADRGCAKLNHRTSESAQNAIRKCQPFRLPDADYDE